MAKFDERTWAILSIRVFLSESFSQLLNRLMSTVMVSVFSVLRLRKSKARFEEPVIMHFY